MRLFVSTIIASVLFAACGGAADTVQREALPDSELNLLFVANEGVLVSTQSNKVLIDALFTRPNPAYAAPPVDMLDQMETGQPPFDGVDVVLVTHNHPDHFEAASAGRFLTQNPRAVLVVPADAAGTLRDSLPQWDSISDRVISIGLDPGESVEQAIGGVTVTAYRTLHSGQRDTPQNLMYLIEMEGRTVFHEGDSDGHPDTFSLFDLSDKQIDLALVHFWFPTNLEAERTLREILRADHVGLFHFPLSLMESAPETLAQVMPDYTDMFLLTNPGERKAFPR